MPSVCPVSARDLQDVSPLASVAASTRSGAKEDTRAGPGRNADPFASWLVAAKHGEAGHTTRLYCEGPHWLPPRIVLRLQAATRWSLSGCGNWGNMITEDIFYQLYLRHFCRSLSGMTLSYSRPAWRSTEQRWPINWTTAGISWNDGTTGNTAHQTLVHTRRTCPPFVTI